MPRSVACASLPARQPFATAAQSSSLTDDVGREAAVCDSSALVKRVWYGKCEKGVSQPRKRHMGTLSTELGSGTTMEVHIMEMHIMN